MGKNAKNYFKIVTHSGKENVLRGFFKESIVSLTYEYTLCAKKWKSSAGYTITINFLAYPFAFKEFFFKSTMTK